MTFAPNAVEVFFISLSLAGMGVVLVLYAAGIWPTRPKAPKSEPPLEWVTFEVEERGIHGTRVTVLWADETTSVYFRAFLGTWFNVATSADVAASLARLLDDAVEEAKRHKAVLAFDESKQLEKRHAELMDELAVYSDVSRRKARAIRKLRDAAKGEPS